MPSFQGSRLGIGVLGKDRNGQFILGISPYAGSQHRIIFHRLIHDFSLRQIVWMGELRYSIASGKPYISEANETSGYFKEIIDNGIQSDSPVEVYNDVRELPEVLRSTYFSSSRFSEVGQARLARELQNIKGDVRHGLGNALQIMQSISRLAESDTIGPERKVEILEKALSENKDQIELIRWFTKTLLEENRLKAEDVNGVVDLINLLQKQPIQYGQIFDGAGYPLVRDQLMALSKYVVPTEDLVPVRIWQIQTD